jgi:soluble lytic murein transglycosylase-like protein
VAASQRLALLLSLVAIAAGVWYWRQPAQDTAPRVPFEPDDTAGPGLLESVVNTVSDAVVGTLGLWRAPAQYAGAIADAETAYGLPAGLLERLLWQESRYRADIISGAVSSSAGAKGIAQFMPATAVQYGVDPLDPFAAIDGAGRYLRDLYRQFGNWTEALAAYNWGPGNVRRKGLAAAPAETRNYYTGILADVGQGVA